MLAGWGTLVQRKAYSRAHLSNGLKVPLWLLLLDGTRGLGLSVGAALGHGALAATTAHGDAVDHITWNVSSLITKS